MPCAINLASQHARLQHSLEKALHLSLTAQVGMGARNAGGKMHDRKPQCGLSLWVLVSEDRHSTDLEAPVRQHPPCHPCLLWVLACLEFPDRPSDPSDLLVTLKLSTKSKNPSMWIHSDQYVYSCTCLPGQWRLPRPPLHLLQPLQCRPWDLGTTHRDDQTRTIHGCVHH